ncbi:hypothetical protein PINS_up010525 [Pythium insidiosum]|nr:hypothetical protein PINS_up010525 [Pythium insidiosum]
MTGLTRVVIIQDANVTQKYQELLRKLESMGGNKVGRHVVHCRLFNRKAVTDGYSNQRMFMLRMSQNDDLIYAVLVNERKSAVLHENGLEGIGEECALLECGLDGANILQQVEIYTHKSDGQFEGTQYTVGDFVVSVCMFMPRNKVPGGLIMEVQYSPCYTVSSIETLFDEFLANFTSEDRIKKPIDSINTLFDKVGLSMSDYSLKHTALQYVAVFNLLRRFEK